MRRIVGVCGFLALAALASGMSAHAEQKGNPAEPMAAHLFGYYAKDGMEARFDAGYRRHLVWHRENHDPLPWYGWYVTHGPRSGMFVDGTFGASFAAFDNRVDPAGDGADAEQNFLPFATPAYRATYRLRPDLGNSTPLESRRPTPLVAVFRYQIAPGGRARFASLVRQARSAGLAEHVEQTWYEGVGGTGMPEFMLMVARSKWADFASGPGDLESQLDAIEDPAMKARLLQEFASAVNGVEGEVWVFRQDLSLIPEP